MSIMGVDVIKLKGAYYKAIQELKTSLDYGVYCNNKSLEDLISKLGLYLFFLENSCTENSKRLEEICHFAKKFSKLKCYVTYELPEKLNCCEQAIKICNTTCKELHFYDEPKLKVCCCNERGGEQKVCTTHCNELEFFADKSIITNNCECCNPTSL